jgi:hypothetical protein
MSIKIAHTVQGVRLTQLDSSTQATIQIIIDDSITNNAEASYTSGNLVVRAKSTCNRNHFAAGVNTDVPSYFYARVMSSGGTLVTALSQTDLGDSLLQYDTDADLSDLSNCHVVTSTSTNDITTYDTDFPMLVEGTLFHDPEDEVLIIRHSTSGTGTVSPSLMVNQPNNAYGGSNGWRGITGDWTVDSEGYFVLNMSTTDAWGHTYQVGDAIEHRGGSATTKSGGTQEQRDYIDSIYRHCHRIMAINGNLVTISLKDPYDGDVTISGGEVIRRAIYNYGQEINSGGRTRYSSGVGLIMTGTSQTAHHPNESGIYNGNDGMLYLRGGTIMSNRPGNLAANVDIAATRFVATKTNMQIRTLTGWFQDVTFTGWGLSNFTGARTFEVSLQNSTLIGVLNSNFQQYTLKNFDVSKNTAVTDIGADSPNNQGHLAMEIINSANGSNIKHMWRTTDGRNSDEQRGAIIIKKEVSLNIQDPTGNNISDVKVYLQDNPSDRAKDSIIADSDGSFAGAVITVANAEVDSATGGIKYLYANPLTYNKTTDANGNIDTFTVTTATQILEFNGTDDSARQANGGPYNIPSFSGGFWRESDGLAPAYTDWDTDRFGGFYKVDRRSNSNTDADDFTFKFCSYKHLLSTSTQALKGVGELQVNWVLFDDKTISEPDILDVLDYGAIDTPQKFYDRAKAHLYNNYNGETELIVTRDGNTIIADGYNVIITDNSAAAAFSISGDTITIKATTFIGNILTDALHTTSLQGGSEVIGTFGDIVNLPWEVTNVESGSTVQLYNVTRDVELHNGVTDNGTPGEFEGTFALSVGGTSSPVTITANTKGNSAVTLTGDGSTTISGLIDAWNTANPINTIALTGSGSQTPADETTITIPAGDKATAIGSYSDTQASAGAPYAEVGDTIRLRITCQAGVFAFFPYETFGITTTSGITFKADQRLDFFYNDNGIDGSALEYSSGGTLTADYTINVSNDDGAIDIDEDGDDGKIDVRGIYAFYVYQTTTPTGIANWFGAITPIDHQNYRVNNGYDIKLENTGNNTILVTGARLFREDGQSVLSSASNAPMMQDNGELVQYIRTQVNESIEQNIPPAVSDAVNANETITTIKKKTNLIPGLL